METTTKETGLHITRFSQKDGKMKHMAAISVGMSAGCRARMQIHGSVCERCYAARGFRFKPNNERCFERNGAVLEGAIPDKALPYYPNIRYMRFLHTGDLSGDIMTLNYARIAANNPETRHAIWSKEWGFINCQEWTENINKIFSTLMIDDPSTQIPAGFHARFSVFSSEAALTGMVNLCEARGVRYHVCDGKECISCLHCYKKSLQDEPTIILEIDKYCRDALRKKRASR